jgi:quercetin dioxygenase-like cupin family protein
MTEPAAAHLLELERLETGWGGVWRPVRRQFDIPSFGVNAWTAESAGERVVERHREPDGPQELYLVLDGHATFTVGEETIDAPQGTFVYVPPDTLREAFAVEPGTTVVSVGAKAGEVFAPSPWEDWAAADGYRRAGDLGRARSLMDEAVARNPGAWQGHYNRACFESLAGARDAALDALARAVELDAEATGRAAAADEDLAAIRDDPRFRELVG